jgi:hypothetical protein
MDEQGVVDVLLNDVRAVNLSGALGNELANLAHVGGDRDALPPVGILSRFDDPGVAGHAMLPPDAPDLFVVHLGVVVRILLLCCRMPTLALRRLLLRLQISLDFCVLSLLSFAYSFSDALVILLEFQKF